jgi:hypothetical protein
MNGSLDRTASEKNNPAKKLTKFSDIGLLTSGDFKNQCVKQNPIIVNEIPQVSVSLSVQS